MASTSSQPARSPAPSTAPQRVDLVVLGAGAAGLMCAAQAGRRGRNVLVLDHADRPGKKILISGGGRCNFTNLHTRPENFLSENLHFARSALARFTPQDFIALVEKHRIPFHEKTLGQLFCNASARQIVTLLEAECAEAKVRIRLSTRIDRLSQTPAGFALETSAGPLHAESVVVATGGLSIPKLGATAFGYEVARQFGLRVVEPRPALVPLTLNPADRAAWCTLAGVSTAVNASVLPPPHIPPPNIHPPNTPPPHIPPPHIPPDPGKALTQAPIPAPHPQSSSRSSPNPPRPRASPPSFQEKLLITHRGLSGPAILQLSSYWSEPNPIELDLAPGQQVFAPLLAPEARRDPTAALAALRAVLPARWAERWLQLHLPPNPPRQLSNQLLTELECRLHAWRLIPAGTDGFEKAEVTAGGVHTAELNARTLESRKVPGLYFIGEVVDVTGWLGGYNFQWAWASGVSAGDAA